MNNNLELKAKIGGMYSFKVKRADGTVEDLGHQKNLILNTGIDRIYAASSIGSPWVDFGGGTMLTFARVGTGSTAVTAADTALATQTASTSTQITSGASRGITYNNAEGSAVFKRTYQFAAASGSSTIREVGIGWTASTASTLFSRIVLNTPISLNTGDVLFVVYNLKVIYDQIVNSTEVNLTTGTFAMVGDLKITGTLLDLFGMFDNGGASQGSLARVLTGANGGVDLEMRFGTNTAFPAVNTAVTNLTGQNISSIKSRAAHTNGTNTTTCILEYQGAGAVTGIRTIGVAVSTVAQVGIFILLDNAQTKEDLKLLRFTYTVTYTQI